jgi:electron transfer flavoprotein beta subunit
MDIAVLVKQVPDTYGERKLDPASWRVDRGASDAVIDEIDAKGVELALQLVEAHGGSVTVVTMGPADATDALRKALAMGADSAVHVTDDDLAGSDALATSRVLAQALGQLQVDLVVAGSESTDGRGGAVPAMIAERLGLPAVTAARSVTVDGGTLRAERVLDTGWSTVTATLPAVLTVHEKIGEPRYPNFKGIMAAKKKPLATKALGDLGLDGAPESGTQVVDAAPKPPKTAGEKVTDDGDGGTRIAAFLAGRQLI